MNRSKDLVYAYGCARDDGFVVAVGYDPHDGVLDGCIALFKLREDAHRFVYAMQRAIGCRVSILPSAWIRNVPCTCHEPARGAALASSLGVEGFGVGAYLHIDSEVIDGKQVHRGATVKQTVVRCRYCLRDFDPDAKQEECTEAPVSVYYHATDSPCPECGAYRSHRPLPSGQTCPLM